MGKMTLRKFWRKAERNSIRGRPDGQYFVAQYQTFFERKSSGAVETVVLVAEAGHWKVTMYILE